MTNKLKLIENIGYTNRKLSAINRRYNIALTNAKYTDLSFEQQQRFQRRCEWYVTKQNAVYNELHDLLTKYLWEQNNAKKIN